MTFGDLFRDVYSRLGLESEDHSIYYDDIVKAINGAIRVQRIEYIKNGIGFELAETEILNTFTEDTNYPFLNSDTLSKKILDDVPISLAILSSTAYNTSNTIQDSVQTFSKGDTARKDGVLYKAIDDISGINTYNLTFNPKTYRLFWKNNQAKYKQGDVVWDKANDDFYKVNTDFINSTDTAASSLSELDKLYWRRIGSAHIYISHYPFTSLQTTKLFDNIGEVEAISVRNDTVYGTKGINEVHISYVPKWTDVTSLSTIINIPDFMAVSVKNSAIESLARKLGIQVELQEPRKEENE